MPNWCHNTLTVEGSPADVEDFITRAAGVHSGASKPSPLCFASLVPEPGTAGEGDYEWWSWRITNWGCKWEPSFQSSAAIAFGVSEEADVGAERHPAVRLSDEAVAYNFDTPWGPPIEWIERVSALFPELNLSIRYGEPGMGFGGIETYRAGEVVASEEGDAEDYLDAEMLWY